MTNTMKFDFNNKVFADTSVAVMNDIFASNETGSTMEDLYNVVCKYVKMTRDQFENAFNQAEEKIQSWKNSNFFSNETCELNMDELDMVAGGGFGSFFQSIGNGIASAAKSAGNFVLEHAPVIGMIVGSAAVVGGIAAMSCGIPLGAALTTFGVVAIGVSAEKVF